MARFLKKLYIEAGLTEASFHTGRRTFITSLAERGIDLKAIAALRATQTSGQLPLSKNEL